MASLKRIVKEYEECSKSPPVDTTVRLIDESDVFKWEILIDGPANSPYAVRCLSISHFVHEC
jgi:ubiquitin-conjugating enzyme E2 D/E